MNIIEVKTYEFKTNLSRYIAQLQNGEADKIVVMNRDKPVGEFVLPDTSNKSRNISFGIWDGAANEAHLKAFFDPEFEADIAEEWYQDS